MDNKNTAENAFNGIKVWLEYISALRNYLKGFCSSRGGADEGMTEQRCFSTVSRRYKNTGQYLHKEEYFVIMQMLAQWDSEAKWRVDEVLTTLPLLINLTCMFSIKKPHRDNCYPWSDDKCRHKTQKMTFMCLPKPDIKHAYLSICWLCHIFGIKSQP